MEQQRRAGAKPAAARGAYTAMFERFRDELDEHHDRRERITKVSRDVTALSKKIIFSLQRVRSIRPELPADVDAEVESRLSAVAGLLASVAGDLQGINRWRYAWTMRCLEELVEALTFAHYLRRQSLMGFDDANAAVTRLCERGRAPGDASSAAADQQQQQQQTAVIPLTRDDFLMGVFDLSGEMMRFATTTTALSGELAASAQAGGGGPTILADMQALASFFEMLPQRSDKAWLFKMETLGASVQKVEKLGYGLKVRGSERPKGWMPDDGGRGAPPSPV